MYKSSILYFSDGNFERAYRLKQKCEEKKILLLNVNECLDLFLKLSQLRPSAVYMDLSKLEYLNNILKEIKKDKYRDYSNLKLVAISDDEVINSSFGEYVSVFNEKDALNYLDNLDFDEVASVEDKQYYHNRIRTRKNDETYILLGLGISPKHTGYLYLKTVLNYLFVKNTLKYTIKECYEMVSAIYRVSTASVERAIRSAINYAWDNFGKNTWNKKLQATFTRKPTARTLINTIVERVLFCKNFASGSIF